MKTTKKAYGGTAESSETGTFIGGENASSMYKNGGGVTDVTKKILNDYIFEYHYPKYKRQSAIIQKYKIDTSKIIPIGGMGQDGFNLLTLDGKKTNAVITVINALKAIKNGEIEFEQATDYFVKIKAIKQHGKGGNLKKKANYVPNYMVQSVEVERKGKTTDIDGANVLDGVYVKKGVKFETGGRIKVGTFNEAQLKNKEDKKAVEKAQKETGLKYVDTKIIKKGGKMFMEVYLIPTDEYLKSSKFANGGDLADMPESFPETDMMSYEDGGSTSNWEYSIGGL